MKDTVFDIKSILKEARNDFIQLSLCGYKANNIDSIANECIALLDENASDMDKMTSIGNIAYDLDALKSALTSIIEESNKWIETLDGILGNLDNDEEDLEE